MLARSSLARTNKLRLSAFFSLPESHYSMTSPANPTYSTLRRTTALNTLAERFEYVDSVEIEGTAPDSVLNCARALLLFLWQQKPDLEKLDPDDPSLVFSVDHVTSLDGTISLIWTPFEDELYRYQLTLDDALYFVEAAWLLRKLSFNGIGRLVPELEKIARSLLSDEDA